MDKEFQENLKSAAELILQSERTTVFSGAGISVESGIPPFRGEKGLWNMIDPYFIDIKYFEKSPEESWKLIDKFFYKFLKDSKPNKAHTFITELQNKNLIQTVITQNIDCLHQAAGNKEVYEYHGTLEKLVCLNCGKRYDKQLVYEMMPPVCPSCKTILKPDFIFFGEAIPQVAQERAEYEIMNSKCFILIGTSGEIMPASLIPHYAKQYGSKIIEINTNKTNYTDQITDIFLEGRAGNIMEQLFGEIEKCC